MSSSTILQLVSSERRELGISPALVAHDDEFPVLESRQDMTAVVGQSETLDGDLQLQRGDCT